MPRTFSQTVNAAQMLSITPTVDLAAGTMTVASRYVVGAIDGSGQFHLIKGAANAASATVTVSLSTSLASANMQLQLAIALQEGLDITQTVETVQVLAGGSGYVSPTVTFSAPQMPGGATAAGTVIQTDGVITAINVTDGGSGYMAPPAVSVSDSAGTGATAMAEMLIGDRVLAPV